MFTCYRAGVDIFADTPDRIAQAPVFLSAIAARRNPEFTGSKVWAGCRMAGILRLPDTAYLLHFMDGQGLLFQNEMNLFHKLTSGRCEHTASIYAADSYDCYFSEYEELLERLIRVCHFYKSALKVLRKELKKGGQIYAEPDLERLITALKAAEPERNADPLIPYVRLHILEPLLREQDLRMKDIDFSAFDMEDLRALIDYASERSELADKLETMNDAFCRKAPAAVTARAFC